MNVIDAAANVLKPPIGNFNELTFEVSSFSVVTFDDYRRRSKGRWARHDILNGESVLERLGNETDTITLEIKLLADLGVKTGSSLLERAIDQLFRDKNPLKNRGSVAEQNELVRRLCKEGVADWLVIGNAVIGDCLWVITDVTERVLHWTKLGRMQATTLEVTFESYAD